MVEKLYDAITDKNIQIVEMMNMFGDDYWYVKDQVRAPRSWITCFLNIPSVSWMLPV